MENREPDDIAKEKTPPATQNVSGGKEAACSGDSRQKEALRRPIFPRRKSRKNFWTTQGAIYGSEFLILRLTSANTFGLCICLLITLVSIAICWPRLHDAGKSGWHMLWIFLPVIGWVVLLVLLCLPGEKSPNKWGEPPKKAADDELWDRVERQEALRSLKKPPSPSPLPQRPPESLVSDTNLRKRFVEVGRVVTSSPQTRTKIVALKTPPGQLTLAALKERRFIASWYAVKMTVKYDEAGAPIGTKFETGPKPSLGGRIMWGCGIAAAIFLIVGLIVSTAVAFLTHPFFGLFLAVLSAVIPLVIGVVISIDIAVRRSSLRDRLELIGEMLPRQREFVPPEHSSFDFGGKNAAEIAAEFMPRTGGAANFISDPETIARYLGENRKLSAIDPKECIFLFGTASNYNLLTTRGIYLCRKLLWWKCWEYTYRDIAGINLDNNFVILREKDEVYSHTDAVPLPGNEDLRPLILDFIRGMQERG